MGPAIHTAAGEPRCRVSLSHPPIVLCLPSFSAPIRAPFLYSSSITAVPCLWEDRTAQVSKSSHENETKSGHPTYTAVYYRSICTRISRPSCKSTPSILALLCSCSSCSSCPSCFEIRVRPPLYHACACMFVVYEKKVFLGSFIRYDGVFWTLSFLNPENGSTLLYFRYYLLTSLPVCVHYTHYI